MGRGFRCFWTGLLVLLSVSAEAEDPAITVEISPEEPGLDVPWIVTFMVDHPSPSEVIIQHPALPPSLALESVRTGARYAESRRWTAVEFWFIPQRPGPVRLRPFTIILPGLTLFTEEITGLIQGKDSYTEYRPYLVWDSPPGSLGIGESLDLALRLVNWDPQKPRPGLDLFRFPVLEDAVLEELPPSERDQKRDILLRLLAIPLGGEVFSLPSQTIRYEDVSLTVPSLRIPLQKSMEKEEIPREKEGIPREEKKEEKANITWENLDIPPGLFFRRGYEKTLKKIQVLWDQERFPEALAEMRRNERDRLGGSRFARLRRSGEALLGLDSAPDEGPRPPFIALFLGSLLGLIFIIFKKLKRKTVTFCFSWGYTSIILAVLAVMAGARALKPGPGVVQGTDAYRVPDLQGGINAHFDPGQAVIIRSLSAEWGYVESLDGRIGWVLRDHIIIY
jgi:hypothetical protein